MKGIVLNSIVLAGKKYKYNDVNQGIIGCPFPLDKFYGGRVGRFGKTSEGVYLCLEHTGEEIVDIFIDIESLQELNKNILLSIAENVKLKKAAYVKDIKLPDAKQIRKMNKDALIEFILSNAVEVFSNGLSLKATVKIANENSNEDNKFIGDNKLDDNDNQSDAQDDEPDDGFDLPDFNEEDVVDEADEEDQDTEDTYDIPDDEK
jgi:hypothetical protein